ncbi:ammonium transporter [Pseudoalteromonas luteoviolacea]|uniref:Ammonium transporter n=1 Tax=Pseudoalteromonas luteoviolacea DSM 6061 TaxID=1365250 RepID=A0A167BR94_9GAMM|nr:ammonium transporter [Pseudoalteromonas luteoviolacea]KZN46816.1 ammonium transporter [Pseudoalteromonas luteoviolacea DSM 6061]KZN50518.1 ammonium transporter [Pseudoalteromonas luteoviolacea CPMOR-2]MBE0385025.1 ammonium transporter, Amt family [Pseudoalteromonas luteoviolacea DSM 6061]TQF69694.1 ammonium transporter [Pseudoalteromonas luteoviolacea]
MDNAIIELQFSLNTFYFLISGVLVMWMAAGFAMLEAGLVRSKNTTEILTKNIALYAIACTMYLLIGYNIMYVGNSEGGFVPSFGALIGEAAADADHALESDFFFQVVFVATAMSIVSGAVAERMKLWAFLLFTVVLTGVIYPIEGYWTWGAGFLSELGFVDFAGSAIVHGAGAAAALAGVLLLGARKGKYGKHGEIYPIPGSNLPLATLGTFILWMGWFGFNGGSQLFLADKENAVAVSQIMLNTNAAAAAGAIAALIVCKVMWGKADLTMILNGALAGLVTITAEPASPTPLLACILGALGGSLVVFSIIGLDKLKIDDPVGAISVHGVCGSLGVMMVPFSNSDASFVTQLTGLLAILGFVFVTSYLVWAALKATMGIRVSEEEELSGMDQHDCGVDAYPEFVTIRNH